MLCDATCLSRPLTTVEWYLVFTCGSVVLSQLPKLNSLANVSLIGAISYVSFCTLLWVVPVAEGRLPNLLHNPVQPCTQISRLLGVVNGLGFIALAFRGHNLILEIQLLLTTNEQCEELIILSFKSYKLPPQFF